MSDVTELKLRLLGFLEDTIAKQYKEITGQTPKAGENSVQILNDTISFLLRIIHRVPGHIFWLDSNNVYLGCNESHAKNANLTSVSEIIGKTNRDMPWYEQADMLDEINNKVIQTGNLYQVEEFAITAEHPEGGVYLSEKKPLLNANGEIIGVLGIAMDISKQKELEKQLKIANELKNQFVQNMQHDLRTPTSGSMAMLEYLAARESDPVKKQELAMLYKAAKRIYNICNEIIDFEQIAQHKNPILSKKFNLHQLVQEVIELNHPAAKMRDLELTYIIDPKIPQAVITDPKRLGRLLINLIGNAIKFTEKGHVTLEIKPLDLSHPHKILLEFQISDTGIGIPADKKDLIYEKFSRLNPANQGHYLGSGLGLNIVKHYVQDLKGEIEVKSEVGKGTTFFITLPLQKPLNQEIRDQTTVSQEGLSEIEPLESRIIPGISAEGQAGELEILVVEDHKMTMIATLMSLRDAEVSAKPTTAENFTAAMKLLREKRFDLVISDLGLPDGDGCDIPRIIKADPQELNYKTPFFALTAHSDRSKKEETETAGFILMLTKPLAPARIKALIDLHVYNKIPEKETPISEDDNEIIDLELGEELIGQREGLALELLNMLAAELPKEMLLIQDAFEHNNIERLRAELHKFKGGLAHCGTPRLQTAVAELEGLARNVVKVAPLKSYLETFYKEANLFLDVHARLRRKAGTGPEEE